MKSSSPSKVHGADTMSKGLRPSLRTLCGRFFCGSTDPHRPKKPCPGNAACLHSSMDLGPGADEIVDTITDKAKITCRDCLDIIAQKSAELAKSWAKGTRSKPWY